MRIISKSSGFLKPFIYISIIINRSEAVTIKSKIKIITHID